MNKIHLPKPRMPDPPSPRSLFRAHPEQSDPGPVPPVDLSLRAAPRAALYFEPLNEQIYASLPEKGREIQRAFYRNLEQAVAGSRTQRGRAVVVVPARNEEKDIASTLDHLQKSCASDRRVKEIVVVDNASTDHTLDRIREWAGAHAGAIELVDHTRGGAPKAGGKKLRLHLMEQPIPGKTGALLEVKRLFSERGAHPEWMVQVDADTRVQPGNIAKLIDLAEERGQIAATGNVQGVRRDGKRPFGGVTLGGCSDPVLIGNFVVARTAPWIAAYETIRDQYPQSATEDKLMTAIFRMSGFSTGSRVDAQHITYETLAAGSLQEARSQMTRWLTGDVQLESIYGTDAVKAIGLRGTSQTELVRAMRHMLGYPLRTAQNNARKAVRSVVHPIAATKEEIATATARVRGPFRVARQLAPALKEPTRTAHDVIAFQIAAIQATRDADEAAERAEAQGRYSWTPGR